MNKQQQQQQQQNQDAPLHGMYREACLSQALLATATAISLSSATLVETACASLIQSYPLQAVTNYRTTS
jgi:hypothetical protein